MQQREWRIGGCFVVATFDIVLELQHANEHGRHPLGVGYRILFDMPQRKFWVKTAHHHDGAAQGERAGAITKGRGVVKGAGERYTVSALMP